MIWFAEPLWHRYSWGVGNSWTNVFAGLFVLNGARQGDNRFRARITALNISVTAATVRQNIDGGDRISAERVTAGYSVPTKSNQDKSELSTPSVGKGDSEERVRRAYDDGPSQQPQLIRSVVGYIDVLGVRETMRADLSLAEHTANLVALHDAYAFCLKEVRDLVQAQESWGAAIKTFTDNVVIAYPLDTPGVDEEMVLGLVTIALADFQIEMALRGFFVRGAIDIGNVYLGDDIAFGPAIVSAYALESTTARDPRIVLSNAALAAVRTHTTAYATFEDTPQYAYILVDADRRAFINYLAIPLHEADYPPHLPAFEGHKEQVETMLSRHQADPYVWSKYRWVASYHNFICQMYSLPASAQITGVMELKPTPLTPSDP